jgi:hypothetical protein
MASRPIAHYILQAGSSNKKQPNRPLPASWRRQRSHQPPSDPVGAAQFCAAKVHPVREITFALTALRLGGMTVRTSGMVSPAMAKLCPPPQTNNRQGRSYWRGPEVPGPGRGCCGKCRRRRSLSAARWLIFDPPAIGGQAHLLRCAVRAPDHRRRLLPNPSQADGAAQARHAAPAALLLA